jgi:hypothetical protein
MRSWHRILLSLLLALALPIQGHAARTMLWCGGIAPTSAQAHRHDAQHAAPALADEHAAHHHMADAKAADAKSAEGGKCSVCAACCTGAALLRSPLLAAVLASVPDYGPLTPRLHAHEAVGGLERPPRSDLA